MRNPMRWISATDRQPADQGVWCLVRLRSGLQPRVKYTYNGSAWHRSDGDYDSEERRNPGTIAAADVVLWKDVHAAARRKIRRHGELFELGLRGPGSRSTIGQRRRAATRAGAAAVRATHSQATPSPSDDHPDEDRHE